MQEARDALRNKFSPFFDQDDPEAPILGMIASLDQSEPYELEAAAVFKCSGRKYLVVYVSGCSCWPDRGGTSQTVASSKTEVEREIRTLGYGAEPKFSGLIDLCQQAKWKVTQEA